MADITLVATMDTSGIQRGEKTINQSAIAVSRAVARADTEFARLDKQLKQNKISLEQHSQATRKVTKDLAAFKAGQSEVGNMFNNIERQLVGNTRSMSKFGVGVQQAGYQVGDFLVQIQSGTNAFVAFGQQATQLVGILPMFNPALVGLSAGLGIAIPLVTAIGAYFSRAGDTAGAMEDQIKDLESAVRDYTSALEASRDITGHLRDEFGVTSNILRQLVQDFEELARIKVFDEIGSKVAALRTTHLEGFYGDLENIKYLLRLEGLFAAAGQEVAQFDGLLKTVENDAVDLGDRIAAAMSLRDILLENSGGIKNMKTDQEAFYNDLVRIIQQMEVFREQQKETSASLRTQISHQQQIATIQDQVNAARKELRATYNTEERSLQQQIALARMKVQFGEDSVEVERLIAQQARENYRLAQLEKGIKGNLLNDLMEQYDTHVNITNQIGSSADNARDLADALREANSAMAGLAGFSASLDKALAVSVAKVEALRTGANAAVAGTITGMRVDLDRRMQEAVGAGVDRSIVESMFGAERSKISQLEASENQRVKLQESLRGGSSGGGASGPNPIEQAQEYLEKIQREAEFKRTLVGLTDEQATQEERRNQLLTQLNGYEEGLGEQYSERINQIIQMETETRKLMEAEQQREQMMTSVQGHIESAFMSFVDGSKSVEDAFKSMLRNIILEIYQTKVAEPAANAIMDLLFSAKGNVFNGGAHVKAYADGGVVNRTTAFPMRGGVGIMGEAGPEAIMPLKRGKNGKLGVQMEGSGGGVTIHQNFNFSANGDDSVKRIIRGEIPRITEATKAAVVDAKRRGGSYGRSF